MARSSRSNDYQKIALLRLLDAAGHHADYYFQLTGAAILALGGIFTDSIAVLIASMIIAPLAQPILGIAIGVRLSSSTIVRRMLGLLITSIVIVLAIAFIATSVFSNERVRDVYVSFTENLLVAFIVALTAGAIAAYGLLRPRVSSAITGVAIAVSLLPPLAAVGVGLASGDGDLAQSAFWLFFTNIVGIVIASTLVFALFDLQEIQGDKKARYQ